MEALYTERDINIISGGKSITFAHKRNIDLPQNHNLHLNSYYEIYVYIEGDLDYLVKDKYYTPQRGDIIVISPYEVHKAILKSRCRYERFYLLVPTDAFSALSASPFSEGFMTAAEAHKILSPEGKKKEYMLSSLYEIDRLINQSMSDTERILAYSEFLKFMAELRCELMRQAQMPNERETQRIPEMLSEILKYIDRQYADISTAGKIAEQFNISATYLSALFSKYIGVSVKAYLSVRRVAAAKLLLESGKNVTEACYAVGFSDCSYFIKVFKRYVGTTPYKYVNGRE